MGDIIPESRATSCRYRWATSSESALRRSVEEFERLPASARATAQIICNEYIVGKKCLTGTDIDDLALLLEYDSLAANRTACCALSGDTRIDCHALNVAEIRNGIILVGSKSIPWRMSASLEVAGRSPKINIETLRDAVEYFDTLEEVERCSARIRCDALVFGLEELGHKEIEELVELL